MSSAFNGSDQTTQLGSVKNENSTMSKQSPNVTIQNKNYIQAGNLGTNQFSQFSSQNNNALSNNVINEVDEEYKNDGISEALNRDTDRNNINLE